ncbi:MAG: peptidoglycan recognition protein family protein [Planctomycetota bacterium]
MTARIRVKFFTGLLLLSFFFTCGCDEQASIPRVTYRSPNTRFRPSSYVKPRERITPVSNQPRVAWGWAPPRQVEKAWDAIIIHHTATYSGNMAIIDEWHRDKGWDGVGYDFVIGNGTDSRDGQVEVTFRWRQQLVGAHTKTPNNWGNEDTIGICLVGDFTQDRPSWKQLDSLKKLIRFLQQRYRIPTSRVYGHGSTPGARVTDCPGKNFPMWSFKSQL